MLSLITLHQNEEYLKARFQLMMSAINSALAVLYSTNEESFLDSQKNILCLFQKLLVIACGEKYAKEHPAMQSDFMAFLVMAGPIIYGQERSEEALEHFYTSLEFHLIHRYNDICLC